MNPLVLIGIGAVVLMAMGGKKKPEPEAEPEYDYEPEPEPEPEPDQTLLARKVQITTQPKAATAALGNIPKIQKAKVGVYQPPPVEELKAIIGSYATTKLKIGQKQPIVIVGVGDGIFVPVSWKPWGNAAELIQEDLPPNTPLPGRRFTIVAKNPGIAKFQFHPASGEQQELQTATTVEVTVS